MEEWMNGEGARTAGIAAMVPRSRKQQETVRIGGYLAKEREVPKRNTERLKSEAAPKGAQAIAEIVRERESQGSAMRKYVLGLAN